MLRIMLETVQHFKNKYQLKFYYCYMKLRVFLKINWIVIKLDGYRNRNKNEVTGKRINVNFHCIIYAQNHSLKQLKAGKDLSNTFFF